ncbi:hypothetical protein [Luteolibacter arcticus]|uniref:hypothetical protein n=1 Tax=Luteolibacter arcticus TaxID=1581411 RepID=UPI0022217915|nr:hypothetical protein [Luteolibacter arcticus]
MGDLFGAKVLEELAQVLIERPGKFHAKPGSAVSAKAKSKPVLMNFFEAIPRLKKSLVHLALNRLVAQEPEVSDNLVVKLLVFLLVAGEEEERVDEQRQIDDW